MKIGIYNEQPNRELGGAEYCMAVLAEALAPAHSVELVNHSPDLTIEQYAQFAGTDLRGVRLRCVPLQNCPNDWLGCPWFPLQPDDGVRYSRNPWQRYQDARTWHADLSRPYDLFVNFAHWMPPFCHARRGVLVVLFPIFRGIGFHTPNWHGSENGFSSIRSRLKHLYYQWEWKRRLNSYQHKLAISNYTAMWTKRWWGCDCTILYPPVDTRFEKCAKENAILSVGRFTADGPFFKKQREMTLTFHELREARLEGWEYTCVGGLSDRPVDVAYFNMLHRLAEEHGGQMLANLKRTHLLALYQKAKIFWHAAGYGVDDEQDPTLSEHFGIATVEAMAAGCVPVVINKGAQPEIVEHGVSGFLWNSLKELQDYTMQLIQDESLRARMSEAARSKAQCFSRETFARRFLASV
jgi:glycosyltransferase involved in cell wall biosynthesis